MVLRRSDNRVHPRIVLHGGGGNITKENLPPKAYDAYKSAMLAILHSSHSLLQQPGATALDVATYAVTQMEDNALFNSGHGAVFTTAGTHELEASVMVTRGYRKRGVGVMKVRKAKNPIKLAREMLIRGEEDGGGGAGAHLQLEGSTCDELVERWGLEMVRPSYFWTRRRWDEHRLGLGLSQDDETYERDRTKADQDYNGAGPGEQEGVEDVRERLSDTSLAIDETLTPKDPTYNPTNCLPQGTVGAVVLDSAGTICAATSTGGLTNKLPGRIGDTPTLGAGFWAEEWRETSPCRPNGKERRESVRAVGLSGTGNGDSFLKTNAARTAAAVARFSRGISPTAELDKPDCQSITSLQQAVTTVAGPNGILQQSAEDRWQKTGEGQGGLIGIELRNGKGRVGFDFNCAGMWHAWVDDQGMERLGVFQDENDDVWIG